MKNRIKHLLLLPMLFCLSGCALGERGGTVSALYGVAAVLSVLLFLGYLLAIKAKERWFLLLFGSVAVVNLGYFLLSLSQTLTQALMANRIAYLGSVFLAPAMLMIILKVCRLSYRKWLAPCLIGLGILVFLIAASPGILPIYYKEVTLGSSHGATVLEKVYGPLHITYLFYLIGYFGVMLAAVIRSAKKKKLASPAHAVILLSAVFINILVWLLGQIIEFGFEPLSLSYIISELFLLGLYLMLQEAERMQPAAQQPPSVDERLRDEFLARLNTLTKTERTIFNLYCEGRSTAEVLESLGIKENTLKYHNKNIYGKMEVPSRKILIANAKKFLI